EARPAPRYRTRAKMTWDNDYFYVGARLEEPHVWGTLTKHDSVIFQDNDFEIFIDPDADNHQYLELEINALNTEWDLRLVKAYRDGGPALNEWEVPGLKTAVAVEGTLNDSSDIDTAWTVEWAIPWKVLAEFAARRSPPAAGDTWRVNFSRVEWRHTVEKDGKYKKIPGFPEENWVWSPQGRIDMHRPELWGHVKFVKSAEEAKKPVLADDQAARWFLLEIYDSQKAYNGREKKYASTLQQLGLKPPAEKGWQFEMELQPDGSNYMAKVTIVRLGIKPLTLQMQADSKISRTPAWDYESN
ncbi:MAG: carbohydrate-binding family 9-like protein, partial [Isosphaeraceae bacterium]